MTVTYSLDVANTRFYGFTKLLMRWKGSIYKILWKEFLVFAAGYTALSLTYRKYLNDKQKKLFEDVVVYCETFIDLIPLSFVLGFYVSLVIGRWWNQFDAIPFPDKLCYLIGTYVHGADDRSRMIRRTLGRYLILLQVLTFQSVSTAVKRRFPTIDHIQAAGLMTKEERTVYEKAEIPYGKWWLPAHWFCALAMRARKEGRIKDSILLDAMMRELIVFRTNCGTMFSYDWISVPLVYTQVVAIATYTYSLALLIGRQYLDPSRGFERHQVDLYIPVFTLLQFFFYTGWLKVAEQIVNPYGEDDDDFELNWCIDRSTQIVFVLVDHLHTKHPKLRRDCFWDEWEPHLPHTKHSANVNINPMLGSTVNFEVNPADAEFLPHETLLEEDNEANVYKDSMKRSSRIGYRPSFLMNMFNSGFAHNIARRSSRKGDGSRKNSSIRGHINPAFSISEKYVKSYTPPPTNSIPRKTSSGAHSRSSSISFLPNSFSKRRHKLHDFQNSDHGVPQPNGAVPDNNVSAAISIVRTATASVVANFDDTSATPLGCPEQPASESCPVEENNGPIKPNEPTLMPPIPEEPCRPTSLISVESTPDCSLETSTKPLDDVQELVIEANKVLEELNRVVREQGHGEECMARGYESCCSLSSDDSSEEDTKKETENYTETNTTENAVAIEMISKLHGDDVKCMPTDSYAL